MSNRPASPPHAPRPTPRQSGLRRTGTASYAARMDLEFSAEMWFWRGPSPWHFVTVPAPECGELAAASAEVTYG